MTSPLPPLLLRGDCLVELARIPEESIDAVICDPPYGLGFMGKGWDIHTPLDFERFTEVWSRECYRILKPGGHMLAFGGSRTWHRLAAGIEDAGFEIRDSIAWLYGSGFPKSMDVSKAIDKAAGATREKVRKTGAASAYSANAGNDRPWMREAREAGFIEVDGDEPATDAAREWEGWGTALKPAFEPIVVGRKPLGEKTVAANVLAHGTGALNIDASRIGSEVRINPAAGNKAGGASLNMSAVGMPEGVDPREAAGRWPANVVLDESQAAALDEQAPKTGAAARASGPTRTGRHESNSRAGAFNGTPDEAPLYGTELGGASRFFYVAKAPKSERPIYWKPSCNCGSPAESAASSSPSQSSTGTSPPKAGPYTVAADPAILSEWSEISVCGNCGAPAKSRSHETVKPLALMRWLIRLVTPPGGCVVDPFAGSGTTLEAAYLEGFESIGVELTPDYWPLIEARIARVTA